MEIEDLCKKKIDKSLIPDIIQASMDLLCQKVEREYGLTPSFLKELDSNLEGPFSQGEKGIDDACKLIANTSSGLIPGKFALERIFARGFRSVGDSGNRQLIEAREHVSELKREVDEEKLISKRREKNEYELAGQVESFKRKVDDYRKQI